MDKCKIKTATFIAIKNSLGGTILETHLNDLYEKIVDINNLKTFSLLERFQHSA